MTTIIHRHRRRILIVVSLAAAAVYLGTMLAALHGPARLAAFVLAGALSADMTDSPFLERAGGTCMVLLLSIFLVLEGVARARADGMAEISFLEIALGVYLAVASWLLMRRRTGRV